MEKNQLWEKAAAFHGHVCGGLAIGYRAALYAMELLELDFSEDEEVVCVTENDACGVDAIQSILGCSVGKGNLLFRLRGKQVFSFFNRKTGKSVRLSLKPLEIPHEEKLEFLLKSSAQELFDVGEVSFQLPEQARIFFSLLCAKCGELTAEPYLHLENGIYLCPDCWHPYKRFL